MSENLSVASVIEKNRLSSDVPFLVLLDVEVVDPATGYTVEFIRIANNTEAVTFNGYAYQPASFDIELKSESGTQQSVTLSINDQSRAIQARMQAYGGGVGFAATIYVVNAGNLAAGAEIVEYFEVTGASASNYVAKFTLGAENSLTKTFPRRKQTRDFCQWRYKESGTCGYTGDMPTCDLTLEGANGGYPGINSKAAMYG
jgi:phage-related protein